jgi:predicted  nucleic acid-binding Zn-ribbon protein
VCIHQAELDSAKRALSVAQAVASDASARREEAVARVAELRSVIEADRKQLEEERARVEANQSLSKAAHLDYSSRAQALQEEATLKEQREELTTRHARARQSIERLATETNGLQSTLEEARTQNAHAVSHVNAFFVILHLWCFVSHDSFT